MHGMHTSHYLTYTHANIHTYIHAYITYIHTYNTYTHKYIHCMHHIASHTNTTYIHDIHYMHHIHYIH